MIVMKLFLKTIYGSVYFSTIHLVARIICLGYYLLIIVKIILILVRLSFYL